MATQHQIQSQLRQFLDSGNNIESGIMLNGDRAQLGNGQIIRVTKLGDIPIGTAIGVFKTTGGEWVAVSQSGIRAETTITTVSQRKTRDDDVVVSQGAIVFSKLTAAADRLPFSCLGQPGFEPPPPETDPNQRETLWGLRNIPEFSSDQDEPPFNTFFGHNYPFEIFPSTGQYFGLEGLVTVTILYDFFVQGPEPGTEAGSRVWFAYEVPVENRQVREFRPENFADWELTPNGYRGLAADFFKLSSINWRRFGVGYNVRASDGSIVFVNEAFFNFSWYGVTRVIGADPSEPLMPTHTAERFVGDPNDPRYIYIVITPVDWYLAYNSSDFEPSPPFPDPQPPPKLPRIRQFYLGGDRSQPLKLPLEINSNEAYKVYLALLRKNTLIVAIKHGINAGNYCKTTLYNVVGSNLETAFYTYPAAIPETTEQISLTRAWNKIIMQRWQTDGPSDVDVCQQQLLLDTKASILKNKLYKVDENQQIEGMPVLDKIKTDTISAEIQTSSFTPSGQTCDITPLRKLRIKLQSLQQQGQITIDAIALFWKQD